MSKSTPLLSKDGDSTIPNPIPPIRSRRTAAVLLAGYALVVAVIVFWPTADVASGSVLGIWTALQKVGAPAWISTWSVEFVTNMLMFMPLSFLGATFRPQWRWRQWLVAGLAGSLLIETTQWVFLSGRSAQLDDLASNTLGALAGYGVVVLLQRRRKPVSPSAGRPAR